MEVISIVDGDYNPTNMAGGYHLVDIQYHMFTHFHMRLSEIQYHTAENTTEYHGM